MALKPVPIDPFKNGVSKSFHKKVLQWIKFNKKIAGLQYEEYISQHYDTCQNSTIDDTVNFVLTNYTDCYLGVSSDSGLNESYEQFNVLLLNEIINEKIESKLISEARFYSHQYKRYKAGTQLYDFVFLIYAHWDRAVVEGHETRLLDNPQFKPLLKDNIRVTDNPGGGDGTPPYYLYMLATGKKSTS
jgi:hypothetical protein